MRNKTIKIILVLLAVATLIFFIFRFQQKKEDQEQIRETTPVRGAIQSIISTTGTVLPKNRLEVKPPVNGRIESILVKEGEKVAVGQTLAWMSSTERAALLDAARGKGEEALKYWQDTYKPIPLISPIDGEVIVATTQPGQTVTTSEAVVVLSDRLIVRAQVDETDIGKIKTGQKAYVSLDAYPDTKVQATVEHIYYESKTVNNVTMYEIDVIPQEVLQFFRSGMSAEVNFIEQSREGVLLLPLEAVHKEKDQVYVLVRQDTSKEPLKKNVSLGIADEKNIEVLSGLDINDRVIVKSGKFVLPKNNLGTNPLLPGRRR
jgi:macrolide-specific efflux system membrane fusion protein